MVFFHIVEIEGVTTEVFPFDRKTEQTNNAHSFLVQFPLDLELNSNEWEDLDQELDSLDDIAECDQCSIEAASDLVREEEEEEEETEGDIAYNDDDDDDDDDNNVDKEVNTKSDAEDDIELEFASLQLINNNSSSVAAFLDPCIYKLISDTDRKAAKKIIFKKLDKSNINHLTSSSSSSIPTLPPTTTTTIRASKLSPLG
ncbi:unnamed protein product [Rotaria magnacalcarata]|uniref:Uncharacterized protein n=2 Tax=Rotaria magnacalcarata TaxID=392030 RepID=A0A816UZ90_9BILA|nr:unnamed protein product [Rotaria magnacalcarata]